jgi:hypothetical protein
MRCWPLLTVLPLTLVGLPAFAQVPCGTVTVQGECQGNTLRFCDSQSSAGDARLLDHRPERHLSAPQRQLGLRLRGPDGRRLRLPKRYGR